MKFKLRVILFLATIFLAIITFFALTTRDDNKISKDEFKNIHQGMSIQEVRKIIGGDGEENKLTDTITEITYKSIDGITNGEVKFSFKDDKLFSIGDFAYASSESKTYPSDQNQNSNNSNESLSTTTLPTNNNLEKKIKDIVKSSIGSKSLTNLEINKNMGTATEDDKIAILTIHASDNLTDNMFKQGMWMDTQKILKGIANEKEISEIAFFWQFETVDPYGTKKVDNVMKIIFNRETIDKINFSNFIFENIPKTATTYWEHPSLKKE
ncbi:MULTISPECIES: hypothetical protein [Bacillus]|uniref:Uncharacterized protein n=2 Tax=Bacillus cereus group TaxID=86661 RepID=A0A9W5QW05_BACCE|nr:MULTISPECIES: hypothetical protein [Bacillus cereus group]AMR84524.1 hypothetical protein A3L20_11020 [Bacillus thuringiensis]EOP90024.1 hypothetical protein IGM_02469 [Bacillus cereus HuB4-4]KIP26646.1 hypothetical protein BG10_5502 [Bacillus thuringiensis serovar morrisoni]MBG9519119.1 hypothetical protein [Bacillus thuringiensis]MBG9640911.1 hypothetical protein [Bacillus thuringiensis]